MKEGRKPEYSEKTTGDKLQKMPHTKTEDSSPNRDSNPYNSIGGRLGKQTCQPLHYALLSVHVHSPMCPWPDVSQMCLLDECSSACLGPTCTNLAEIIATASIVNNNGENSQTL